MSIAEIRREQTFPYLSDVRIALIPGYVVKTAFK